MAFSLGDTNLLTTPHLNIWVVSKLSHFM
jgi:hypothetical protein